MPQRLCSLLAIFRYNRDNLRIVNHAQLETGKVGIASGDYKADSKLIVLDLTGLQADGLDRPLRYLLSGLGVVC